MTNPAQAQIIGIPWYELEDYANIYAVMEDRHLLPKVYSIWRMKAEQIERQQRRQGKVVVRAHLRAGDFKAWCAARGLNVDAHARTQFAAWAAGEVHRTSNGTG